MARDSAKWTAVGITRPTLDRLHFLAGDMSVAKYLERLTLELANRQSGLPGTGSFASTATIASVKRDTSSLVTVMSAIVEALFSNGTPYIRGEMSHVEHVLDEIKKWRAEQVECQPGLFDGAVEAPG